jgi:adenine-specific DNA-methyltransferase
MATLNFKGKTFVQNHHLAVPFHQLVPNKSKSLTKTVSLNDNLIIHGDNLKALKALLPTYAGKIKCIYIDPPYNTGNENWAYNDNVNSPMMQDWLGKIVDKDDLTKHDKWLCMMTPRLKLLRELLSEDGVIFVSCDDNENHHLKALLDEIFGEENFVVTITVKANPRGRQSEKDIAIIHDFLICYAKNDEVVELSGLPLTQEDVDDFDQQDESGKYWRELGLRQRGSASLREDRPDMYFPIYVNPENGKVSLKKSGSYSAEVLPKKSDGRDSRWMWSPTKVEKEIHRVYARKIERRNEYDVFIKDYLEKDNGMRTTKAKSIWLDKDVNTEVGGKLLKQIIPGVNFQYPKPVGLVKKILRVASDENSIILDSFAGSGTTAHAVLELNKEDGGSRQFILVECEDYADNITAERVRRIIKGVPKVKNEQLKEGLGGTFSFFQLGDPIEMEAILEGDMLPSYLELARYIFYTATGEEFNPAKVKEKSRFIGESHNYEVYLFYKPDIDYLKTTAFRLEDAKNMGPYKGKKRLVFAPSKYLDTEFLIEYRIDYCQLPFEIYKLKG